MTPATISCLGQDLEERRTALRLPAAHRSAVRTTTVLEPFIRGREPTQQSDSSISFGEQRLVPDLRCSHGMPPKDGVK